MSDQIPIEQQQLPTLTEKSFDINTLQFSLTYPQARGLSRQKIQDHLKHLFGTNYSGSIIAEEEHEPKPGDAYIGLHYHVYLFLVRRRHITNKRFFDMPRDQEFHYRNDSGKLIDYYHPNIQETGKIPGVKARFDKKHWIQYVTKSDKDYLEDNFDVQAYLLSTVSKKGLSYETAALAIKSGKTIEDLDSTMPGFVLREKRKLEEYVDMQESFKRLHRKEPFVDLVPPIPYTGIPCVLLETFYRAINDRVKEPYKYGGKHIYVSGPTACGKSNPFSEQLPKYLNGYKWIYGGTGQSQELLTADYIYLDEFKGQILPDELILLLNQDPNELYKIRYGKPSKLPKRLHVFINAQNPLDKTYKKVDKRTIKAIKRRLEFHYLLNPIIDVGDDSDDDDNNLSVDLSYTKPRSEGGNRIHGIYFEEDDN